MFREFCKWITMSSSGWFEWSFMRKWWDSCFSSWSFILLNLFSFCILSIHNWVFRKYSFAMAHSFICSLRKFLFKLFSLFFLNLFFTIIRIRYMFQRFEKLGLNFTYWISSKVSRLSFYFSSLISNNFLFCLRILLNITVSGFISI